jgi:hypothetical protein
MAAAAAPQPLLIYVLKTLFPGHIFQYLFFGLTLVDERPQPSPSSQGVSAANWPRERFFGGRAALQPCVCSESAANWPRERFFGGRAAL